MQIRSGSRIWWLVLVLLSFGSAAGSGDLRLVEAVKAGDRERVRALLQAGSDVNERQGDGTTALAWAAYRNDLETAELLLGAGAEVNAANAYSVTALSLGCTNGNAAMVEKLLRGGANPNTAQRTGETALMTCARTGNVEAVESLLRHGAEVNAKEPKRGQTALMWAVAQKHSGVVRALVAHQADIHARTNAVAKSADSGPGYGFVRGDITGLGREGVVRGNSTALLFAAQQGDVESARILLEAGADVNETTPEGLSVLLVAIDSGHESLARFLVEKGANPNAADSSGLTALHYALLKGLSIIQGLRFRITDPMTPYLYRRNMAELVKVLLAHGAKPNERISKQLPPNSRNRQHHYLRPLGATPFLLAAASGDAGTMRSLVQAGADPLLMTEDRTTALLLAAGVGRDDDRMKEEEEGALEAVKLALELGADLNATNRSGTTALHGAAFIGADSIIQLLVEKGSRLEARDKWGQTALSIADGDPNGLTDDRRRREHPKTAELLRKLGGDVLAQVPAGRTGALTENPVQ